MSSRKPSAAAVPEARLPAGRPPVLLDEHDRHQAEALAAYGLTETAIAEVLGLAPRTYFRRKGDDPALVAALERGRAVAQARVARSLYELAVGARMRVLRRDKQGRIIRNAAGEAEVEEVYVRVPDIRAIVWWERTRCGRQKQTEPG